MDNGWQESASAWIADMGDDGDFGRRYVLDPVMIPRARAHSARLVLDVGCGEGRFCRALRTDGSSVVGVDPTPALLDAARARDASGQLVRGVAESLPFPDERFDLVVSYLSLIDIPDLGSAIREIVRVLRPGGALLIANLNAFNTSGADRGWVKDQDGREAYYPVDHYLSERAMWIEYRGIRIVNYHRPLSTYFKLLLNSGLTLTYFDEPAPIAEAPRVRADRYRRAPWFLVMEWRKPEKHLAHPVTA